MKSCKIENVNDLIEFVNEYYDTIYNKEVYSIVGKFFNTTVIKFSDESKESFIEKIQGFYNYCSTSTYIPPFLMKDPTDEFQIVQVLEAYY